MLTEAVAAALVGVMAVWLVLRPFLRPPAPPDLVEEPVEQDETPRGVALLALKEIEFDHETGKLSETDFRYLKDKYTTEALEVLRAEAATEAVAEGAAGVPDDVEALIAHRVRTLRSAAATAPPGAPACHSCGPRPEPDAVYCSTCGGRLPPPAACSRCGTVLSSDSRFCEGCGNRVAA
jgi:RNA polymerase subunit RPABC4/transcription elongation factor Spt4